MMENITTVNCLFEQPWWLNIVASGQWQEITIQEDGKDIARWAFMKTGTQIAMPPFTQTLGIWIADEILEDDAFLTRQKKIINELIAKLPCKNTKIALAPNNRYFLPFLWKDFIVKPCITYRINDLSDTEKIYRQFSSIVKRNIKSAKNKVTIQEIDDISLLYSLLEKTFALQKRKCPFSKSLLSDIYEGCKQHQACKLLYAVDAENHLHSGTLFVYDENCCYYLVAGSDPEYRNGGANSLLLWEGIQFAAKHSKVFDFEGSMIEGIENFVRQFAATPVEYYEIRRLPLLKELFEICKPGIKRLIGYKQ